MMDALLLIGKITGVHGIRGNLKVISYCESLDPFAPDATLIRRRNDGTEDRLSVSWAKPHQRGVLMAVREIANRTEAEAIVGSELYINRKELPETEEDAYYWDDLLKTEVHTVDGRLLGRIESIFRTGSNDVFVVRDGDRETLIPSLKSVVLDVDLEAGRMTVDLPEGL